MCLFEQFRKVSNLYFVVLIIVLIILGRRSPVSPTTTILPLVFVLLVALAKQAFEDYNRHKSDNIVNSRPVSVLRGEKFEDVSSSSIRLGDLVLVRAEEEFPADLVLLASASPTRTCHITTANFDGETNLKLRRCVPATAGLNTDAAFANLALTLESDLPNHDLYRFSGRITVEGSPPAVV